MYSSYSNRPKIVRRLPSTEPINRGRHTVEFRVVLVEAQFRLQEEDVLPNERRISYSRKSMAYSSPEFALLWDWAPAPSCREKYIPRIPSPPTPLIKLSIQLECCCASRTTMGCPSWRTLCIVIRALNVWISSARTGCLRTTTTCQPPWKEQSSHPMPGFRRDLHFHASPESR